MTIARWAPALVLAQITSLQVGAAVATRLFDHIGTWATVSLRVLFAALVLAVLPGRRLRRIGRGDLPAIAAYALVVSGMNLAYFSAIGRIPLGVATAIELLGPLAIALLAARGAVDIAWVALAIAGLALLTTPGGTSRTGLAFAVAAAAFRAGYVLLTRSLGRRHHDRTGLVAALLLAVPLWLPVGTATGGSRLLDATVLVLALAVGLFSSAIPYSLDLAALRHVSPHTFGILLGLSPVIGLGVGYLALAQTPGGRQLAGMALITVAAVGVVRRPPPSPAASAEPRRRAGNRPPR
ncbi:EamA family transporter [Actinomadura litoris]|uniref:EamA family transporter n=1 Tax=Actinomadura litoris TaxID=2678616 RepID=UPI001FA76BA3|nr:EamA family transporter [Actinomadura litoris]